ncbi:DUF4405 domain-containing protein [uncultured Roseibium sp.]|uniref:DUF4405 domain-containing protein n=1 Tax=uncultured Roseibium sp. TaxID=1936171 RepID=UPI0032171691
MLSFVSRYATPLITGLFMVSLVSGIALFFHVGGATFHGMHEWLSMVLIVPFVAHIWKNWRPFLNYFKRLPMTIALALSVAAAIPFAIPSSDGSTGGNPLVAVAGAVQNAPVTAVAALYGKTPEDMMDALKSQGLTVTSPDQTLLEVASASDKSGRDVIFALAQVKR